MGLGGVRDLCWGISVDDTSGKSLEEESDVLTFGVMYGGSAAIAKLVLIRRRIHGRNHTFHSEAHACEVAGQMRILSTRFGTQSDAAIRLDIGLQASDTRFPLQSSGYRHLVALNAARILAIGSKNYLLDLPYAADGVDFTVGACAIQPKYH